MAFRKHDSAAYRAALHEFAMLSSHPEMAGEPVMEEMFLEMMNLTPSMSGEDKFTGDVQNVRRWLMFIYQNWSPSMLSCQSELVH